MSFFSSLGLAQAEKAYCDLKIEKRVSPYPLVSGQQAVYTITVTNVGTTACPGPTRVTDAGAPGLTFISASGPGWICIGGTCTYLAPIPAGASVTLTYTCNVTAKPGTTVKNCATVTNEKDARPDNNTICLSTGVVAPPARCDLTCAVSVSPNPVISGQTATFTVTVTNVGNAACSLSNQVVVPSVSGLSFVAASGVGWTCTQGGGQVICNYPGTIPPNGSATVVLTYNVTAGPGTTINFCSNVANKDDANPGNNQCCVRVPVVGCCDLTCNVSVSPDPLVSGQPASFTITVTNVGNAPCAVTNQVVVPSVPGLTFVSASGAGWSCTTPPGQVICSYPGTIPPGGSSTLTLTYNVTASPGTTINFCSNVANKDDCNPKNNKCCREFIVEAGKCDLMCRKILPNPLVSGEEATVTIVVVNTGTGACSGPTTVYELGAEGLEFVSASGTDWICVGPECTYPGSIPAGGSVSVNFTYLVYAKPGEEVKNCVVVKNPNDPNPENNQCCAYAPVVGRCDLVCTKRIEPHPVAAGYLVTITVQNVGDGPCPGPTSVSHPGIPGLTFVSAGGPGWSCVGPTGSYASAIPPEGSVSVTYSYMGALPPGVEQIESCAYLKNESDVNFDNNACCCRLVRITAGVEDNFSPAGTEVNNPPPELFAPEQTTSFVGFDSTAPNRWFGHRFVLPQGCEITGATLTLHVKPLGAHSSNDSLILRIGTDVWIARFGPPACIFLQSTPWEVANFPAGLTFALDLASLPGGVNLLPALDAQRFLDVIVQDDTSVDFVELIVKLCCP